MIPFFKPHVTQGVLDAVQGALQDEKLVMGESVFKFEQEFARYIGTRHAVSVNSGNSALFLALSALGIGPGKKVATSTNSFVASASSVLAAGARPVLCDIHESDGNIDISECGEPDALVPVHIYGNPCDWDAVAARAEQLDIPVVEDACQAHGASFRGKKCGSLGKAGCFSFYTTKNMTVMGDGGMVTTDDEGLAETIASMRDNGRISQDIHNKLGYTMRLNTVNAAAGRVQLRELDGMNASRRQIARAYAEKIGREHFVEHAPQGVFHQIVLKHDKRDSIQKHLESKKIGTRVHYPIPIHMQPLFRDGTRLPRAEAFCNRILSLPSFPQLTGDQISKVAEAVSEAIA